MPLPRFLIRNLGISKEMYYKNAVGLAEFPEGDPATFDDKSKDYYDRLDSL